MRFKKNFVTFLQLIAFIACIYQCIKFLYLLKKFNLLQYQPITSYSLVKVLEKVSHCYIILLLLHQFYKKMIV